MRKTTGLAAALAVAIFGFGASAPALAQDESITVIAPAGLDSDAMRQWQNTQRQIERTQSRLNSSQRQIAREQRRVTQAQRALDRAQSRLQSRQRNLEREIARERGYRDELQALRNRLIEMGGMPAVAMEPARR